MFNKTTYLATSLIIAGIIIGILQNDFPIFLVVAGFAVMWFEMDRF